MSAAGPPRGAERTAPPAGGAEAREPRLEGSGPGRASRRAAPSSVGAEGAGTGEPITPPARGFPEDPGPEGLDDRVGSCGGDAAGTEAGGSALPRGDGFCEGPGPQPPDRPATPSGDATAGPLDPQLRVAKRALDLALAIPAAVLALPILAALVPAMWIAQGRPILYAAERMLAPGRPFRLLKLRTMRPAATDSGVSGGDKAARVTPIGGWLRRHRLDEIPQVLNVLRGDMSVVGPRPPLRQYTEAFPDLYARVLVMPPGVTGLATLIYHAHEGRLLARSASAEETDAIYARACVPRKARLDLIYRARWSPCLDLWVLWRTLAALLTGRARGRRRRHH